jgi:hypothetical protein
MCHPKAMTTMLDSRGIRLFDYTKFAHPFCDPCSRGSRPRRSVTIEFIRRMKTFRKEDRIREVLAERGDHVRRTSRGTSPLQDSRSRTSSLFRSSPALACLLTADIFAFLQSIVR